MSSLCHHKKRYHSKNTFVRKPTKTDNKNNSNVECSVIVKKYQCRYCEKEYKHHQTRWTHEQLCKPSSTNKKSIEKLETEIALTELEKQNESLQKIIHNKVISNNREHNQIEELKLQNETLKNLLNQVINDDGKLQLENQNIILQKEKDLLRENTILKQYPKNTQCIYYGMIDNTGINNEPLIKFGNSNSLSDRVNQHKRTFSNFRLVNAFKVDNKLQIENAIKTHHILTKLRLPIKIKDKTHTEILNITNLSFEKLDDIIQEIIINNEYNPEKYKKLLFDFEMLQKENQLLKIENAKLKENNGLVI
jgi:hypothetical protein